MHLALNLLAKRTQGKLICNQQGPDRIQRKNGLGLRTDPFSEEGASDDEGDIDRVSAHNDLVKAFKKAATTSSSS